MNTITVIVRRIIAALNPSTKINDYINNARAVYQSMNGNPYFPALGKEVLSTKQKDIDVSTLSEGVYFVKVETNEGITTKKVVVQH